MRALIIDDEPIARQVLRDELEAITGLTVVGEAHDGESGLAMIAATRPDLVFLDLQMPGLGGFDMIARLEGGSLPVIVVVTAYDQHAIQAFEAGAVDYLLKPVSAARLQKTLERAELMAQNKQKVAESVAQLHEIAPPTASGAKVRKILGRLGEEFFLLNASEVLAFQADGDLVHIVTAKQRYLATQNLRTIEDKLRDSTFRRIHRNAIVNINQIRKMSVMTSQRWLVTLNNGQEFIVSKRQAKNVRDVLSW